MIHKKEENALNCVHGYAPPPRAYSRPETVKSPGGTSPPGSYPVGEQRRSPTTRYSPYEAQHGRSGYPSHHSPQEGGANLYPGAPPPGRDHPGPSFSLGTGGYPSNQAYAPNLRSSNSGLPYERFSSMGVNPSGPQEETGGQQSRVWQYIRDNYDHPTARSASQEFQGSQTPDGTWPGGPGEYGQPPNSTPGSVQHTYPPAQGNPYEPRGGDTRHNYDAFSYSQQPQDGLNTSSGSYQTPMHHPGGFPPAPPSYPPASGGYPPRSHQEYGNGPARPSSKPYSAFTQQQQMQGQHQMQSQQRQAYGAPNGAPSGPVYGQGPPRGIPTSTSPNGHPSHTLSHHPSHHPSNQPSQPPTHSASNPLTSDEFDDLVEGYL